MSSSESTFVLPAQPTYGAVELKEFIRKNTLKGLIYTLSLVILLLLIYFLYLTASQKALGTIPIAPISRISLDIPQQMDNSEETAPPPPADINIQYATEARAGIPVPTPEAELRADLKEFANIEEMSKSLASNEGQIIDMNQLPQNFDLDKKVDVQTREEIPDINDFIPVEKEPQIDLVELQKKIVYPEVARRANIEGQVIVRVLVDKDGKPKKTVVQHSDSQMLDQAAKDAVMKSVFTPAIQNGQPIICWVSIPIKFRLK